MHFNFFISFKKIYIYIYNYKFENNYYENNVTLYFEVNLFLYFIHQLD